MGLAAIPVAITAVAAIAATAAAVQQAQAQQKAQKYNAQMEANNAVIQQQQGQEDAQNVETTGEIMQGKARAAAAASGLSGGSGDDIAYADLVRNDQDALAAKYRGTVGAFNATSQQALDTSAANNAAIAGGFSATGTLLSGASKTYGSFNDNYGSAQVKPVFGTTTTAGQPGF